MKIISIIERLFIYFQVDNNKQLAEKLGVSNTVLSNWKARNTIDYELLFTKCENINFNWLIKGNGQMLNDDLIKTNILNDQEIKYNIGNKDTGGIIQALEMIKDLSAENALLKNEIQQLKRGDISDVEGVGVAAAG